MLHLYILLYRIRSKNQAPVLLPGHILGQRGDGMKDILIYPVGSTAALAYSEKRLYALGVPLVDHPSPEVTHLLLDVPSFGPDGNLRSGSNPERLLERLPAEITVVGGNLRHPILEEYNTIDLLQDPAYLAENAMITADCALQVAAPLLKTTFRDSPALIIGWGRIGKCLGQLLHGFGTQVIVGARKAADRAMASALGYYAVDTAELTRILPECRLLFNTVPATVLTQDQLSLCRSCIKIDLASKPGIIGTDVVWARGLPGIYAPESSGNLITDTFMRLYKEGAS